MPWPELPTVRPAALLPFPLVYLTGLEISFWMFLVCWVSQGFPRFPKVSQGFPSPKTLFFHRIIYSNIAKMTGHTAIGATWWANFRNWPGRQVSKISRHARSFKQPEEFSARVIHNTSVEAWLFAVPGSPNNKTLISPDHRGRTGSRRSTDQSLTSPASQAISTGKVFAGSSKKLACGLHSQDSKEWLECH